jgi:alpha-D-ribose 1-methylphosphonate 5-phosphate C-P lyase
VTVVIARSSFTVVFLYGCRRARRRARSSFKAVVVPGRRLSRSSSWHWRHAGWGAGDIWRLFVTATLTLMMSD